MKAVLFPLLITLTPGIASAAQRYELQSSELTYKVSHITHNVIGKSAAAKGRLECGEKDCELLIAVPVQSFKSGDSNRDFHMIEVTKGKAHPMVILKGTLPKAGLNGTTDDLTLSLSFSGKERSVRIRHLEARPEGTGISMKAAFSVSLTAFGLERPALLMVPVNDEFTIDAAGVWLAK